MSNTNQANSTEYAACEMCFSYELLLNGYCFGCHKDYRTTPVDPAFRLPTTVVRIFDFYLVAVGPWIVSGIEAHNFTSKDYHYDEIAGCI